MVRPLFTQVPEFLFHHHRYAQTATRHRLFGRKRKNPSIGQVRCAVADSSHCLGEVVNLANRDAKARAVWHVLKVFKSECPLGAIFVESPCVDLKLNEIRHLCHALRRQAYKLQREPAS